MPVRPVPHRLPGPPGHLDDHVYLEHGAHYAIGALATVLLVTIRYEINEIVTGLIGVVLIGTSFWSSVRRNRALAASSLTPRPAEFPDRRTEEIKGQTGALHFAAP